MLDFWEIPLVEDAFRQSLEMTKFSNIRANLEQISQTFSSPWRYLAAEHARYNVLEPSHPDYHKFRRGVVGGYVDYMSDEDIIYVRDNFSLGEKLKYYEDEYREMIDARRAQIHTR
jgi:hypothetical protein